MNLSYLRRLKEAVQLELREHRSSFCVYMILRILIIVIAILQFKNKNYENVFFCILTLILFIVPSLIQLSFKIEIPKTLEIIIYIFIFSAEILGEINNYYLVFPLWDTMLHTINGFIAAAIGFSLVNLLNNSDRLEFKLSPLFFVLVSFCFSMSIGVLWEFFEFGLDMILGTDTQKDVIIQSFNTVAFNIDGIITKFKDINEVTINGYLLPIHGYLDIGLIDTMKDLLVNFIGALVFSIIGFIYLKQNEKGKMIRHFILTRKKEEKDYLSIQFKD